MIDVERFVDGLHDYIGRALRPVTARMTEMEAEIARLKDELAARPEKGEPGERGERGEKGDSVGVDDVMPMLKDHIDLLVSAIPHPKDGKDGKSVTVEDIEPIIEAKSAQWQLEFERRAEERLRDTIDRIPQPRDGRDGVDGKDADEDQIIAKVLASIKIPQDGKDGKDADEDQIIAKVLASIKIPQDGKDGKGVTDDQVEKFVTDYLTNNPPKDGNDGKSITLNDVKPFLEQCLESKSATWQLEFERRALDMAQKAIDKMPEPKDGKDGKDGIGLESFEMEYDGERTISFRAAGGEITKTMDVEFPFVIDKGVYDSSANYRRGDGVTWGGSFWIAQKHEPSGKPGQYNRDWRLAVKKGRDGKPE